MGLQVEKLSHKPGSKERRKSVADSYKIHEKWLQGHRVELNAMTSPVFLDWITRKIKKYGRGKLIPPQDVLSKEARDKARDKLREKIRDVIEAKIKIDEIIEREFVKFSPLVHANLGRVDLLNEVAEGLSDNPVRSWRDPIKSVVDGIIDQCEVDIDIRLN